MTRIRGLARSVSPFSALEVFGTTLLGGLCPAQSTSRIVAVIKAHSVLHKSFRSVRFPTLSHPPGRLRPASGPSGIEPECRLWHYGLSETNPPPLRSPRIAAP